jgi:hypothetical protein
MKSGKNPIGIRLADTAEGRNSASLLISKMYAWRGYAGVHHLDDDPNRLTLTASDQGNVIGTLTIGVDSHVGLLADGVFKVELDRYRNAGARVCEVSKFAFDTSVRSKLGLASMFHLAVIYARDFYHCTHIFIEVNPRHRRFYEQMLGFQCQGEMKINARVNAPAYLLCVDLEYVTEQIEAHGGSGPGNTTERSFYPLFFSAREENSIIERLRSSEPFPAAELQSA